MPQGGIGPPMWGGPMWGPPIPEEQQQSSGSRRMGRGGEGGTVSTAQVLHSSKQPAACSLCLLLLLLLDGCAGHLTRRATIRRRHATTHRRHHATAHRWRTHVVAHVHHVCLWWAAHATRRVGPFQELHVVVADICLRQQQQQQRN